MWTKVKWAIRITLAIFLLAFLHYTLPHHDIVRVTNIDSRITTLGVQNSWAYGSPDSGTAESTTSRDIRFIDAVFPDGEVMVYRNEDTGWIWPPYFKYDSSNLQAEAGNLKSDASNPKWVIVTHYGWRLPILSIYPNAVSLHEATGPDQRIIPWVSGLVIAFLIFAVFMIRRMWAQFWERSVEPVAAEMGEAWDGVEAQAEAARDGAKGLFSRVKRLFTPGQAQK